MHLDFYDVDYLHLPRETKLKEHTKSQVSLERLTTFLIAKDKARYCFSTCRQHRKDTNTATNPKPLNDLSNSDRTGLLDVVN